MPDGRCSIKKPVTVKDLLELLTKINTDNKAKTAFLEELKKQITGWYSPTFPFGAYYSSPCTFDQVLQLLSELRESLLKNKNCDPKEECDLKDENVVTACETLTHNIYDLYACLCYLYFMCANDAKTYGGGQWNTENVNGGGNLKNWLTDNVKNHTLVLRRGFADVKLDEKTTGESLTRTSACAPTGPQVDKAYSCPSIGSLAMLIDFSRGGMLQFPLEHMLLLGRWSNAKTAHALMFLGAFCDYVSNVVLSSVQGDELSKVKELFNSKDDNGITPDSIKSKCTSLSSSIKEVTQKIGAGTIGSYSMYSFLLNPNKFSEYLKWLEINLHYLVSSLTLMKCDIEKWTKEKLTKSESYGPFAFGFCFKNNTWHDDDKLNSTLSNGINSLINQLQSLQSKLPTKKPNEPEACSTEYPSNGGSSDDTKGDTSDSGNEASSDSGNEASSDSGNEASSDSSKDDSSEGSEVETKKSIQEIAKGNSNPSGNTIATASGVAVGTIGLGTLVTYGAAAGHLGKTALGVFNAISSAFR